MQTAETIEKEDNLEISLEDDNEEAVDPVEPADPPADEPNDDQEDGEVVIQIGDEAPPASEDDKAAPQWVKDLRQERKELKRRVKELEEQAKAAKPQGETPRLEEKPKLEQFDYDEEAYQSALDNWYSKKLEVEAAEKRQKEEQEAKQAELQKNHMRYQEAATQLKAKDFKEVEEEVVSVLSEVQQGLIVQGADNAALLVYALGKNPAKMRELASIKDPVKFAFAVAKLEKDLKVTTRKGPKPAPESVPTGSAPKSGAIDTTLEKLRAEAEKTGDYTKVHQYKRKLRDAG